MKKLFALVLVLNFALFGCASTSNSAGESTALSAGIGCVGGVVLAKILGEKPVHGCVAGAVVGAVARYTQYQEQKKKELAAMQEQAKLYPRAQIETKQLEIIDSKSNAKTTVQAFQSLSVPLPKSSLTDPDGQAVYSNLARLAEKNGNEIVISGGTATDREAAARLVSKSGFNNVTTDYRIPTSVGRPGELVVTIKSDASSSVRI